MIGDGNSNGIYDTRGCIPRDKLTQPHARLVYHRYVNMSEASRFECISRLRDYENWLGICFGNMCPTEGYEKFVYTLPPFPLSL